MKIEGKSKMRNGVHAVLSVLGLLLASAAWAAPSVTINSVVQRWPWNNKVDISYTVSEGQEVANAKYRRMEFIATIGGNTYVVDGNTLAAPTETGPHRATWTCPSGFKASDCTMVARMYESDVPSGDDYMIINITNGVVTYEGLYTTQSASNDRYNTAAYKENLMVFRKVPVGTYKTGHNDYKTTASGRTWWNSVKTTTTTRAYYIGVFPVTQYQYQKVYGSNPSTYTGAGVGDVVAHRPVDNVTWINLRGNIYAGPSVEPNANGTFIARFNALTSAASGLEGFDLPSEMMHEIAQRAGRTTKYSWGDDVEERAQYCAVSYGETTLTSTVAVGSRLPNDWGIYDTAGNMSQWMRDTLPQTGGNLPTDANLSPLSNETSYVMIRGGNYNSGAQSFHASFRGWLTSRGGTKGSFRMSFVVK